MPTMDEMRELREQMRGTARTGQNRKPVDRTRARPPGAAPLRTDGTACKTCEHLTGVSYAKTYYKCALNEANWTCGTGTDLRLSDAACARYEPEKETLI